MAELQRKPHFNHTHHKTLSATSPLTFSFGGDGSLRIHYVSAYDEPQITFDGEHFTKAFAEFDPGSSVTITADVEIGAEEFEKMANSDYSWALGWWMHGEFRE